MDADDELRLLRDLLSDLEARLEALESSDVPGSPAIACVTASLGSYPTSGSAGKAFGLQVLEVTGAETEGGSATTAATGSGSFLGVNLGGGLPPVGTEVVVHGVPYKRVFTYY